MLGVRLWQAILCPFLLLLEGAIPKGEISDTQKQKQLDSSGIAEPGKL